MAVLGPVDADRTTAGLKGWNGIVFRTPSAKIAWMKHQEIAQCVFGKTFNARQLERWPLPRGGDQHP